jgi:hypothetical protein
MHTTDEIITLVGHSRSVRCLHVDGTNEVRLVSGSNDHSIKVETNCFVNEIFRTGSLKVWSISINQTWSKCACKLTLLGHTDTVRCLVVRDDICVSGSHDHSVKVWNLTNGLCLRTLVYVRKSVPFAHVMFIFVVIIQIKYLVSNLIGSTSCPDQQIRRLKYVSRSIEEDMGETTVKI